MKNLGHLLAISVGLFAPGSRVQGQSVSYCDANLWNNTAPPSQTDMQGKLGNWGGEVKILPNDDGVSYPDDFADISFEFTPPPTSDPDAKGTAKVTLTRSFDYAPAKSAPQCVTYYQFDCAKSTEIMLYPICSEFSDVSDVPGQCCEKPDKSGDTYCDPVTDSDIPITASDKCEHVKDALGIHSTMEKCNSPCVDFFFCDHMLISYQEQTTFTLLLEKAGWMKNDQLTMKMTGAGKFSSGCDDTASDYQLQALVYSGSGPVPMIETNIVILLSSIGGLLVVFGGGWIVYFCYTWKRKDTTPEEEQKVQEDRLKEYSESLINPVGGQAELACPNCNTPVNSERFDLYCTNPQCGKPLKYFMKWTQDGDVRVPNPKWGNSD